MGKATDGRLQFVGSVPLALFISEVANPLPCHDLCCPHESGECLARYQQAWKLADESFQQSGHEFDVVGNADLLLQV